MTISTETNWEEVQALQLEQIYEQLAALLNQPKVAERLRTAPNENEWSALEVLGHIIEMIPYWLDHCHRLIAATEPSRFGRTDASPPALFGSRLSSRRPSAARGEHP